MSHLEPTASPVSAATPADVDCLNLATVALRDAGTVDHLLRVAGDQARELIGARHATAFLYDDGDGGRSGLPSAGPGVLEVPLTARDGHPLGFFQIAGKRHGKLEHTDRALLVQLAQLTALAVENLELRARVAETAGQLDSQARLTDVITDNATLALVVLDEHQRCAYLNTAAEKLFGYTLDEIRSLDMPLHYVVHHAHPDGSHYPMAECPIEQAFPENSRERGEEVFVHRDGSFYPVAFTASPIRQDGKPVGTVIEVRAMAREKRIEAERAEENETLETLLRTSSALGGELELERLLQTLTDEATRLCRAQFGAFFYNHVSPQGESYTLYTISGVDRSSFSKFPMPRNTALFGPTFAGEGIVRIDDVTKDPRYGRNPPYHGMPKGHLPVRSYLALPVISRRGDVIGGLFFGHAAIGVFRDRDERLLGAVAAQAAVAIDNARLYLDAREGLDMEARRAKLAEAVGLALAGGDALEAKLDRCASSIVEHLGLAHARVWLYPADSRGLELRASAGELPNGEGARWNVPIEREEIERIAVRVSPVVLAPRDDGAGEDPGSESRSLAFAAYPLLIEGRALGVLAVYDEVPIRQTVSITLGNVANHIALALERDRIENERERFRELFIGMLGHDLRNPLSAISTAAEALVVSHDLSDRAGRMVGRIQSSSARMSRMVNQLLDFARGREGSDGIPINRVPADLFSICRDVVAELRVAHPGREIVERYEGIGSGVWDVDRLAQVFSNLIGNALTYGTPGLPVQVSLQREGPDIVGEVRNEGEPLPKETIELLFDPYRRTRASKSQGTRGLGLGLYITRQIVLAHGGSVSATSERERGTIIGLRLPARGES